MSTVARILAAHLTLWLVAAWTLPVCCLSMSDPVNPESSAAVVMVAMEMSAHQHHHHPSSTSDATSHRLDAGGSCSRTCQAGATMIVMSPPDRHQSGRPEQVAATPATPPVGESSAASSAPAPSPGRVPVPASGPLPLRI